MARYIPGTNRSTRFTKKPMRGPAGRPVSPIRPNTATQDIQTLAEQLALEIIKERDAAELLARNGRVYTTFDPANDIVANQEEVVTKALWSGNVANLLTMFTSSTATTTQKSYYLEIFQSASNTLGAEPQFSIAYGSSVGSGSKDFGGQTNDTPSRAIYSQYRNMVLEPDDRKFTFNGVDTDSIYVVNVNRARMREQLDQGNFEINLAILSGSQVGKAGGFAQIAHTGSGAGGNIQVKTQGDLTNVAAVRIIDDSTKRAASLGQAGKRFNLVSGSIEDGVYQADNPVYYGMLYPQMGVAVLNGDTLDSTADFQTVSGSEVDGQNPLKLFVAMSHSACMYDDASGDDMGFQGRSSEKIKSTYYFVRAKNAEYNYSNNPTFVTGSEGQLLHAQFADDPKVYITGIGLYNNRRELLATAKISKPLLKSFSREALVKVKLDF
jgi:hypothetical protein